MITAEGETTLLKSIERIERAITKLAVSQDPTPTASSLATTLVEQLGENDRKLSADHSKVAFLTETQGNELKAITSEKQVVRFLTPHLRGIFDDPVVVNSEEFPWLVTHGDKQKPDLFVTHKWAYTSRVLGPNVAERGQSDPAFRFGVLGDTRLYDSTYLFDCKINCNRSALGELIIHLQHQSDKLPAHSVVRGMLFGRSQFMLVKVQGQELIERITGTWTEPGSKACIAEFFPALPWCGVDDICRQIRVEIDVSSADRSTAFLGAGSFGRVLRVRRVEQHTEKLALKVSLLNDAHRLALEHQLLKAHKNSCGCDLLVRPQSDEIFQTTRLCGYVMSPVGVKSLQRSSLTDEHLRLAVQALHRLHSHVPPVIHGDPRLPNLIVLETGGLCWVDLSNSQWDQSNYFNLKHDIGIFIGSVLGEFTAADPQYAGLQLCSEACLSEPTDANYGILYNELRTLRQM